ncbi:MAG: hypothetical protein ACI9KK_002944 [Ascidiaceihabitans sp.]|jgi:hypothetical protein
MKCDVPNLREIPMKIYDVEGFPNPARVRIALAEKGATDKVEFVSVDVMAGEHRSDAFKAKNPDAVVPCLELADGSHISQCSAMRLPNTSTAISKGHPLRVRRQKNVHKFP